MRIRLLAPLELRVKTTVERLHCSEAEALDYIRRVDEERTRWARFMYGKNIQDPRLYDVCINMEKISFSAVCSLLQRVLEEKESQPTEESLAKMEEMYVAAQVEASLATHPKTHSFEIGASFHGGRLLLQGPYLDDPEKSLVTELAGAVQGVQAVEYEPGYASDLEFLP